MTDNKYVDFGKAKIVSEIYYEGMEEQYKQQEQKFKSKKEEYKPIEFSNENFVPEAFIDKLILEEDKSIGFDLSLLKRNELYVNLIHFDLNLRNSENFKYYNEFKVDVVGGYIAIDNLGSLERYLEAIKKKRIPFIVISSGSNGKDVISICKKFSFVKEVIIFCGTYEYNKHYLKEYPNYVKKVLTSINDVYKYIKTLGSDKSELSRAASDQFVFSYDEIQMDKQLEQCPVISAYEYDKCYFLIHRAYAHFFGKMEDRTSIPTFDDYNFKKIENFIKNSDFINKNNKNILINKFESLKGRQNFVELAIRFYTGESAFCYILNRTMRNFEGGLISLAYYMGPLLYGLNKYVYENSEMFAFRNDMTLYRTIQCSIFDFYLYSININHIICFPSITSTSANEKEFKISNLAKKINKNDGIPPEDIYKIIMIFHYKHEKDNISPGIIIKDNTGKDGKPLSKHMNENEVILFPFTFARIIKINPVDKNQKQYIIHLDIINRKSYIEYTLRDNVNQRLLFSKLD